MSNRLAHFLIVFFTTLVVGSTFFNVAPNIPAICTFVWKLDIRTAIESVPSSSIAYYSIRLFWFLFYTAISILFLSPSVSIASPGKVFVMALYICLFLFLLLLDIKIAFSNSPESVIAIAPMYWHCAQGLLSLPLTFTVRK